MSDAGNKVERRVLLIRFPKKKKSNKQTKMYVDPSLPVFTEDPSSFFIQGMVTVKSSPNFSMVGLWILIFVCMSIHSWPNIAFYVKFDNLSIGLNMYFLTFRL